MKIQHLTTVAVIALMACGTTAFAQDASQKLANPRMQSGDLIANECKDQARYSAQDYVDCRAQYHDAKTDDARQTVVTRYRARTQAYDADPSGSFTETEKVTTDKPVRDGSTATRVLAAPRMQNGTKIANACKDQALATAQDFVDCDSQWHSAKTDEERDAVINHYHIRAR